MARLGVCPECGLRPKKRKRGSGFASDGRCMGCVMRQLWRDGVFASRPKGKHPRAWCYYERKRLEELAGTMPLYEVAQRLSDEFGHDRTPAAVHIKCVRWGISWRMRGWSMRDVEAFFRFDHRAVERDWVATGLLSARRWQGRGGSPGWWFTYEALEQFIRSYPWAYWPERLSPAAVPHSHRSEARWLTRLAEASWRSNPWLTLRELEHALHRAPGVLQRWVARGVIPHQRRPVGGGGQIMVRAKDAASIEAAIDAESVRRRSAARLSWTPPKRAACRRGHLFTAENTYIKTSGHRECRTCRRARYERFRLGVAA